MGHPQAVAEQRAVLDLAFSTFALSSGPVLLDYAGKDGRVEDGSPVQASNVEVTAEAKDADFATEVTLMRRYWELRLERVGRTGVGLSKVPPQKFRGLVRFLEAFVEDPSSADTDLRPTDDSVLLFLRNVVEDLRVLYAEARLQTHPTESSEDRQRWLLGSTALGIMLRRLRDAMNASEDPAIKAAAFGIAR